MTSLTVRVEKSEESIKVMKNQVKELEGDLQGQSNLYDGLKEKSDQVDREVKEVNDKIGKLESRERSLIRLMETLEGKCEEIQEKVTDQQCRSMKYNLIFTGIEESRDEDSEEVVKNFIEKQLKVEDDVQLANVHRIGGVDKRKKGPRPIIAKFIFYKDMVKVKKAGRNLQGTRYGMNEQYPEDVEKRRKKLYPIAKAERKKGKKVALVRDRLYVENEQIDPEKYALPEAVQERAPRPPPRLNKRARCGSTPEHISNMNFTQARASTPLRT